MLVKHAYLVIAHNNINQIKKLIKLLDDKRNDIYILFDKKTKIKNTELCFDNINSKINIYYKNIDIYWCAISLVEATLYLLEKANVDYHKYYHLLSGADLPLKTQNDIHDYFINSNKEYIHYINNDKFAKWKVMYYHFFVEGYNQRKYKYLKYLRRGLELIQRLLLIDRTRYEKNKYKTGSAWFSITHEFANYILLNKQSILKRYKHTICSDEVFIQTIAFNSEYKNNIYRMEECMDANKRFIDWKRGENGGPHVFRLNDYEELINSSFLFARKFDENIDNDIIEKIYNYLKSK